MVTPKEIIDNAIKTAESEDPKFGIRVETAMGTKIAHGFGDQILFFTTDDKAYILVTAYAKPCAGNSDDPTYIIQPADLRELTQPVLDNIITLRPNFSHTDLGVNNPDVVARIASDCPTIEGTEARTLLDMAGFTADNIKDIMAKNRCDESTIDDRLKTLGYVEHLWEKANSARAAGDYDKAIALYEKIGDKGLSLYWKSETLEKSGKIRESLNARARYARFGKEVYETNSLQNKALELLNHEQYEDAAYAYQLQIDILSEFTQKLAQDPHAADHLPNIKYTMSTCLAQRGLCLSELNRTDEAIESLEKALRLDPELSYAKTWLDDIKQKISK